MIIKLIFALFQKKNSTHYKGHLFLSVEGNRYLEMLTLKSTKMLPLLKRSF